LTANQLFYGDNLDVLRLHVRPESVDLVYLDPPFKSDQSYNVLFAAKDGTESAAQIQAFEDTWHWDQAAASQFDATVQAGGDVADVMLAFRQFLGTNDMLAYLAMMAPRLVELSQVMKPTASIYLHCDPTASHYLKLLMDAVFGPEHFRNEIVWKRSHAHNTANRFGANHDTLLFYGKSADVTWNRIYQEYDEGYLDKHYRHLDKDGRRYKHENPTGAGVSNGVTGQPWRGIDPTAKGRHWARTPNELEKLDKRGLIHWPDKKGAWPYIKVYLDDMKGIPAQDTWTDIDVINMMAAERLGYPTQKPEALLERIIRASSNEGDVVLDPFCGCGTSIAAAQKLNRRWIGIDITHLAVGLIKSRLETAYGADAKYEVHGEPTTVDGAAELAKTNAFEFQNWALGLVGARRSAQPKKGADKGIDGRLFFKYGPEDKHKQIVISVKAGQLHATYVRDLRGVLEREQAEAGVLLSFDEPTRKMREEAASAGFFESPWGKHPRMQLLTIADVLGGKVIDYPRITGANQTFKAAPRHVRPDAEKLELALDDEVRPTPVKRRRR